MVAVDKEDGVNLEAVQNLREEVNLGVVHVTDSGSAVVVAQGHVRGLSRPPSALLGYQPVWAFALCGAVVGLCFHLCC